MKDLLKMALVLIGLGAFAMSVARADAFTFDFLVYGALAPGSAVFFGITDQAFVVTISWQRWPAGILPGQRQMAGTRGPPSHADIFQPRSGAALPP